MTDQSDSATAGATDAPSSPPPPPQYTDGQPAWPRVVGIISIVWGALSTTCAGVGAASIQFLLPMGRKALEGQGEPVPPSMEVSNVQMGLMLLSLVMAVVLIFAGVVTLSRKASGRAVHLFYSITSMVLALPGLYLALLGFQKMNQWVLDNPSAASAQSYNQLFSMIGLGFGMAISMAWPVFCVFWFGALKKRPEIGKVYAI